MHNIRLADAKMDLGKHFYQVLLYTRKQALVNIPSLLTISESSYMFVVHHFWVIKRAWRLQENVVER